MKTENINEALIAWYSQTGNTERHGRLIARTFEAEGIKVHPRPAALDIIKDKGLQKEFYAQHSIPEVWIIDLAGQRLEVYSQPLPDKREYQMVSRHTEGTVTPERFPGVSISVAEIF